MAMAQSLWNQKKQLVMFVAPMFQLQHSNTTSTNSKSSTSEGGKPHGNGNKCCRGDVRRLCKQGRLKEAFIILHVMDQRGIWADSYTYASLLQGCADKKSLPDSKFVHAHIIQTGFKVGIYVETKLVITYAKCGTLVDARQVFDEMPKRDLVSWTAMIAEYSRQGHCGEALTLFYQMQRTGIQPDQVTFASVLPSCTNMAALRTVHQDIMRSGIQSNVFVGSALVDMYAKCGSLEEARHVFDNMPERNVVSWTVMIAGYAQSGQVDEALKLFYNMPERNVVSWTVMIAGYAQNGYVDEALKLFQKMPERDLFSWNVMIGGYAQSGQVDEALKLFKEMPERNVLSWTLMIAGYAKIGHVDEAMKLFQKMPRRDLVSWNVMIAGFAQNGHVEKSLKLFQEMPTRDVVSWSVLIAGYAQRGNFDEALMLFKQMQLTGVKPNAVTFASVLPACARLAALQNGKEVHEDIFRHGFQFDVFVGSALVDMYAKCGSIDDAQQVFDKMSERNVVLWNSMIVGYAMHGCGKKALHLFDQMQHSGLKPDNITFLGVLSACCHAGLVDDGCRYFDCMTGDYNIVPAVEHYCCMVDLLGRAGRLDEAQDFINKLPIKPDAIVWRSLLGACRIHNNIELGEHVAKCLFELDPENSADYVLLSNIYAAAGRWDDKEKVRKMMKDRRVKVMPGFSWIEVNNKVNAFLVGDRLQPQTQKNYAKLSL